MLLQINTKSRFSDFKIKFENCQLSGYSQKEISSTLQISQTTVLRDISFIKYEFNIEYDMENTKNKFAEDYFMAELTLDEIKKKLWAIVDNKRTKDRDDKNIKTTS